MISEFTCMELVPAVFIAGFKDWVNFAPHKSLGVVMNPLEEIEGFQIIHQHTPAPRGLMMVADRSAVACIYHVPHADDPEGYTLLITSLGNEELVEKYTAKGLFKKHVICLLYTSPSPRDRQKSRMPSSA